MASHGVTRTVRTRTDKQRQQDLDKIATYRQLEDEFRAVAADTDSATDPDPKLFQLTTRLLRLNPEYYTVWNVRRRCLISGSLSRPSPGSSPSTALPSSSPSSTSNPSSAAPSCSASTATQPSPASPTTGQSGTTAEDRQQSKESQHESDSSILQAELAFTFPLLLEYPKCYWIWKFRGWILQEAINRLPIPAARKIWETELGLTSKMLSRDRRNFHAWSYRREIVAKLESDALAGSSMAEQELEYTTRMIRVDLSNYSAWHSRSSLLLKVLAERKADDAARKKALEEELALLQDALNVGPEDQSLWFYHQHIISQIADTHPDHGVGRCIAPNLSQEERVSYVTSEIDFIKDLAEDYEDVKWIYQALIGITTALGNLGIDTSDQAADREGWLQKLRETDPLRAGRWRDLEASLQITTIHNKH